MSEDTERSPSRRDFLSGRAAVDALADLAAGADEAPGTTSSAGAAPVAREPYLVRFGRRAMACEFELLVNAGQHEHAASAAIAALDLVDRLEDQLSVYRETSELSRLNDRAASDWVAVEPRLYDLLRLAVRLYDETERAFDITAGPLSKVWGFYRRAGAIPGEPDLAAAMSRVGSELLQFDDDARAVRFDTPGVELNLGSIGKGYALDRAAERLVADGLTDFLWHGGQSSVLARGSQAGGRPEQQGWNIGILDPLRAGQRLAEIRLHNRALGTSGAGLQFFRHGGRRYGHILDPRTGWPAEGVLSATAVAPTAAEADALATAFYVMGVEATRRLCQRRTDVAAVITHQASPGAQVECEAIGLPDADYRLLPRSG